MKQESVLNHTVVGFLRVLVAAVTMALAQPAGADEATPGESALRLAELTGVREAIEQNVEQMIRVQIARNPALAPQRAALTRFFARHMGWEALRPEVVRLYREAFSERELRELVAFYGSPTGRKARERLPALEDAVARIGMERLQEHTSEFIEMTRVPPPAPAPAPVPWRGLGPRP